MFPSSDQDASCGRIFLSDDNTGILREFCIYGAPTRYATKNNCFNFFTYADNDAIGYFRKQGFTKTITLPKSATHGYVKDYDGGTPMQCVLHRGVDYLNIPWMLHRQRDAILQVRVCMREYVYMRGCVGACTCVGVCVYMRGCTVRGCAYVCVWVEEEVHICGVESTQ